MLVGPGSPRKKKVRRPGRIRAAAGPPVRGGGCCPLDGPPFAPGLIDAHCHVADSSIPAAAPTAASRSAPLHPGDPCRVLREAINLTNRQARRVTVSGYEGTTPCAVPASHPRRPGPCRAVPPGRAVPHVAARLRLTARRYGPPGSSTGSRSPRAAPSRPRREGQPRRGGVRGTDFALLRALRGRHHPDGRRRAGPPDAAGRASARGALGNHRSASADLLPPRFAAFSLADQPRAVASGIYGRSCPTR